MSRYSWGRANWRDPSSKYGLEPWRFEEDLLRNIERAESKEKEIRETLDVLMRKDPARQDETFRMIIDWAREWRLKNVD